MQHQMTEHTCTAFAGIVVPFIEPYEFLLTHQTQQADHQFGSGHPVQFPSQRSDIGTGFSPFQLDVEDTFRFLKRLKS